MQNPHEREQLVQAHAHLAAQLQTAILRHDAPACLELARAMISDDFYSLERLAIPGELPVRMQLHEIIDSALRDVIFADQGTAETWKSIVLPDEFGLFAHYKLSTNARWLRLTGSMLVDQGLEALDCAALAQLNLREQGVRLARFCSVNDGSTAFDYSALRAALDPRLLPFLHDWILCVALSSPPRLHSVQANATQDHLRRAFLEAQRSTHKPLPANSDQAAPAFHTPYFLEESTRALSIECNGKQMSALMQRFKPTAEACERLQATDLPVYALDELPESDELIVCPNWHGDHVIYRCMSPLVEGMRSRGVPLLRAYSDDVALSPVELDWFEQTVDITYSPQYTLTHLGAIDFALSQRKLEFAFYPEITSANSTYWMATERIARVQATGYGFPVTTGMPTMDYFIAGADVEGPNAAADYSEQLVLLPGMAVATTRPPAPTQARESDPAELRLVATTSFNKLNIELLKAWNALLKRVPNARMDVFTNTTEAQAALHLPALARYLTDGNIEIHTAKPRQFVIDTLVHADLYLDAFPYGGFNSLVEPLSVACPVLTVEGARARNRLGAALLRRAELPENLIAKDLRDYVDCAVRLLGDAGERHALREQLKDREALFAKLNDPDLGHHMDAAISWMREQGPPRSRRAPVFIRAGEKPVLLSA